MERLAEGYADIFGGDCWFVAAADVRKRSEHMDKLGHREEGEPRVGEEATLYPGLCFGRTGDRLDIWPICTSWSGHMCDARSGWTMSRREQEDYRDRSWAQCQFVVVLNLPIASPVLSRCLSYEFLLFLGQEEIWNIIPSYVWDLFAHVSTITQVS